MNKVDQHSPTAAKEPATLDSLPLSLFKRIVLLLDAHSIRHLLLASSDLRKRFVVINHIYEGTATMLLTPFLALPELKVFSNSHRAVIQALRPDLIQIHCTDIVYGSGFSGSTVEELDDECREHGYILYCAIPISSAPNLPDHCLDVLTSGRSTFGEWVLQEHADCDHDLERSFLSSHPGIRSLNITVSDDVLGYNLPYLEYLSITFCPLSKEKNRILVLSGLNCPLLNTFRVQYYGRMPLIKDCKVAYANSSLLFFMTNQYGVTGDIEEDEMTSIEDYRELDLNFRGELREVILRSVPPFVLGGLESSNLITLVYESSVCFTHKSLDGYRPIVCSTKLMSVSIFAMTKGMPMPIFENNDIDHGILAFNFHDTTGTYNPCEFLKGTLRVNPGQIDRMRMYSSRANWDVPVPVLDREFLEMVGRFSLRDLAIEGFFFGVQNCLLEASVSPPLSFMNKPRTWSDWWITESIPTVSRLRLAIVPHKDTDNFVNGLLREYDRWGSRVPNIFQITGGKYAFKKMTVLCHRDNVERFARIQGDDLDVVFTASTTP